MDVVHAAYSLPARRGDATAWAVAQGRPELGDALLAAGCAHYHYVLDETMIGLGSDAIERVLAESGTTARQVDALCVFHTSPCATLPTPYALAGELRAACGLDRAWSFAIGQQHCVSAVHALRVLDALFARNRHWRRALLVGIDVILSEPLRAIGASALHSDAASATLLGRDGEGARVLAIETFNDPVQSLGIDADGRYIDNANYLWSLISVLRRVFKAGRASPDAIGSVLPHNVNRRAWSQALGALRISEDKLFDRNFARIGHAFGSDAAINIADSGVLAAQGRHLVFASGIGGTFGGFLLETGSCQ